MHYIIKSLLIVFLLLPLRSYALYRNSPTPQLYSVLDNKPAYAGHFSAQKSWTTLPGTWHHLLTVQEYCIPETYQHKMRVHTAMMISGGALSVSGLALLLSLAANDEFTLRGDGLDGFAATLSLLLMAGGIGLLVSGIAARQKAINRSHAE